MPVSHTTPPPFKLTNIRQEVPAADIQPGAETADPHSDTIMSETDETAPPVGALTQTIRPIVSYPSSVMSPTPSPLNAELFTDDRSPSPTVPSPSPLRTPTSATLTTHTPQANQADIMMSDLLVTHPGPAANQDLTPPPKNTVRPLALSRSEGSISVTRAPLPTIAPHTSLQKRLAAAAERNTPTSSNRGPPREPIDKYTRATMPQIYDAHPTAPLDYISIDLIGKWENLSGGKLLAIPFDDVAQHLDQHNTVKGQIFAAVEEITQSKEVSVLAPRQRQGTKETPTSFLIYNLTDDECTLLLERRVWSSPTITFRVTKLNPQCPDFLFQIKGFSTLVTNDILETVRSVWQSEEVEFLIEDVASAFPEHEYEIVKTSASTFLNSVRVTRLDTKSSGDSLQPRFNVYVAGSTISNDDAWLFLRDSLASFTYETPMEERGETLIIPYNCSLCHGVDHPRGLCPFPLVPGWNGPGHRLQSMNQRGRGGRARGSMTRGRR